MATVVIQRVKRQERFSYNVLHKDPATRKTKYYATFPKKKDAQQCANDLRVLIDTGRRPKSKAKKPRLLTFAETAEILSRIWQAKLDKDQLSIETVEGYNTWVTVLNRTFGPKLLCDISKTEIKSYQKYAFDNFTPAYANRSLFIIKQIFKQGLEGKAIFFDPCEQVGYLNEKQHERNNFILPAEIINLVESSQKTRAKFYMPALIFLGAEHAASREEALSLVWKDINFDYNNTGLIRLYRTKNKKERTECMMPRTRQSLLDWQAHLEWMRHRKKIEVKDTSFVFCHLNGTPLKRFDKAWRRICKLAGLVDFHYHDLRHTFCSNLLLSGGDLKDAKEMIGHSDISMTDRYAHLTAVHKQKLQANLAEHYSNPQ
jgi:integrase